MSKYLVDTNLLIDILRGYQPARIFLDKVTIDPGNFLFISTISETEIFAGAEMHQSKTREEAGTLLSGFLTIAPDSTIARLAGDLVREEGVEVADALIAATALTKHIILLTRNRKHLERIENLNLISP